MPGDIINVRYRPRTSAALDVEIFSLADFRRRVSDKHLRAPQRVEFHALIYFASGTCIHTIDAKMIACGPGALLVLRPGQVQRFDARIGGCDGWFVIYRPEFLESSDVVDLEVSRTLRGAERDAVESSLQRMFDDSRLTASTLALHALLRHQLAALLVRLRLSPGSAAPSSEATDVQLQRFERFRQDVEKHFITMRSVADYARLAGCSEKSVGRAVIAATGITAKAYLSQRLALEAKRLLAHTTLSIGTIADVLGFDEPTNFGKFFRRESGELPGDFRKRRNEERNRWATFQRR